MRRSGLLAAKDPITLWIAPDAHGGALRHVFLEDGTSAVPSASEGAPHAAALVRFRVACTPAAPAAADVPPPTLPEARPAAPAPAWPANMSSCVLSASLVGAAALPWRVHVESVLVRGLFARGAIATLKVEAASAAPGEAPTELAVASTWSTYGLHLQRLVAPLDAKWTLTILPKPVAAAPPLFAEAAPEARPHAVEASGAAA